MATGQVALPHGRSWAVAGAAALLAFVAVGAFGLYRYVDNYWLYRGFAPPHDPAYVRERGTPLRLYIASPALAGRRQPVDVYLPPGYTAHPHRHYPVLYLLHGVPGRPGAFLATVRMGVVEDELVALHKAQPIILVMPFGSTSAFTDEEWANGIHPGNGWETFVARDLVRYVDAHFRTIHHGWARGLAGLSEGGYGSLNIGLHHPGEFKLLESWSGYSKADHIASIFGHSKALWRWNSPLYTLKGALPTLKRMHTYVWFYVGNKDHGLHENEWFAAALKRDHVPHKFYEIDGGHNWALWRGNAARAYLVASRELHAP